MEDKKLFNKENEVMENDMPTYEVPTVTTYTDEEILEELGPAQAIQYDFDSSVGR